MCTTNKNKPKKKYTHPPMEDSSKLEDFEYLEYSKHLIDYKGNIGYSNEGFPVDVIGIDFGNGENMFVPANNYEIEIRFHTSGPESTLTIRAVNLSTGECKMATHSHTDYEALREQIYPFKSQDSRGQRNNYSSPHYNRFEPHDRLLDSQFWDLELSSYGEPRVFSSGGNGMNLGEGLGSGSILAGTAGYCLGNYMDGLSRFRPITTLGGNTVYPATSGYRFGPLSGRAATKLGAGLRMGGNILGGFGIAYTGYQMYNGNTSKVKGSLDIGFGVVGFLGPVGLGVSVIYFVGDTFIPGGWQSVPKHMYDQIQGNTYNGVWWGAHNHFK